MGWFLRATSSKKFEIATEILFKYGKICLRQRIIRDNGVRDSDIFFEIVDGKYWRDQKKVQDRAKFEVALVWDGEIKL